MRSGPLEGDFAFTFFTFFILPFFCFFLEKCFCFFFYFFQKSFIAGISIRVQQQMCPPWSLLHCSMEKWCPDDTERDSLGWGHLLGRQHDSTLRSGLGAPRLLKRRLSRLDYCCYCCCYCCCCCCWLLWLFLLFLFLFLFLVAQYLRSKTPCNSAAPEFGGDASIQVVAVDWIFFGIYLRVFGPAGPSSDNFAK